MSIYAQFDLSGPQTQIASNTGWSEFVDWVESLMPRASYPELTKLCSKGESEDFARLRENLERAMATHKPTPDVAGTCEALLSALRAATKGEEILLVTNGVQP